MTGKTRQIAIVFLTAGIIFTNVFLGMGAFTEETADGQIGENYYAYMSSFTPAPFTFAVWLPIFSGCILLASAQALPRFRDSAALDRFAPFSTIGLIANAAVPFIPVGWAFLVVLTLFIGLAGSYRALTAGSEKVSRVFRVPVALFATWALIAATLTGTQLVVANGGNVGQGVAVALIAAIMVFGAIAIFKTGEMVIFVVMAWAALGIGFQQSNSLLILVTLALTSLGSAIVAGRVLAIRYRGTA